jgi:NAD(P)-dependent dehydrogenase (short-subunit alcohol dehydrogenase family)
MDRDPPTQIAEEIESCPAIAIGADLRDEEALERGIEDAAERFGEVPHLVHCAAVLRMALPSELEPSEFREVMEINAISAFTIGRRIAELATNGGSIVFISSVSGLTSGMHSLAYSASKHALHAITEALAIAYGPKGIRVNAICPGTMETPLWSREVRDDLAARLNGSPEGFVEDARKSSYLGRLPTAEQVADLAAFLLSSSADAVTGQKYVMWGAPVG